MLLALLATQGIVVGGLRFEAIVGGLWLGEKRYRLADFLRRFSQEKAALYGSGRMGIFVTTWRVSRLQEPKNRQSLVRPFATREDRGVDSVSRMER